MSNIDVLHLDTGIWCNQSTTGEPHPGVIGYARAVIGTKISFFGGYCGHHGCYHNNISQLDSNSFIWSNIIGNDHQRNAGPMKKAYCGMMSFTSDREHYLFIIGGHGPPPDVPQPNAEYRKNLVILWRLMNNTFITSTLVSYTFGC